MEQWRFRTPTTRTHPISHPTLIAHFAWRHIAVRPGIASVEQQQVRFVDGSGETFDSIIAATGYVTTFPYLPADRSPLQGTLLNLYHRVCHPSWHNLFFVGFFDVSRGSSNIRMMDDQAEYIAAVARGTVKLPNRDAMLAAIAADHAWAAKQFPDSPRYGLELDPRRYRQALARDYAQTPSKGRSPSPSSPNSQLVNVTSARP